jgi:hypothetical protein
MLSTAKLASELSVLRWLAAALLAIALGCGPANPLLGEWEVDPLQTGAGALAVVRQSGDDHIVFEADRVRLGPTELPVRYEVEENLVRLFVTGLARGFGSGFDAVVDVYQYTWVSK